MDPSWRDDALMLATLAAMWAIGAIAVLAQAP